MSMFKVPSGILSTLESIRCHLFNGHDVSSKKASWVQWNKVLDPKDKGCLGVSSIYALNRGLMFKWVWSFLTQNTSLWARVIKAIHGGDGNIGAGGAEQTQTDELAALMQPVTLAPILDRWTWMLNSSGEFSVALVRNLIDVKIFSKGEHKTRWIRYVPIKVDTHAWK
nr:RNA-directed DNA polymerase, eukaryota [Tanacetum cinerariifolium]